MKDDVLHELRRLGIPDEAINRIIVYGEYRDHIEIAPLPFPDGHGDMLLAMVQNPERWKKNPGWFTRHQHRGAVGSWRERNKYSLHLSAYPDEQWMPKHYEVHIDHFGPAIFKPNGLLMHYFLEYLPHKFTGRTIDPVEIGRGLQKKDHHDERRRERLLEKNRDTKTLAALH